jgi:hypothetical protein
MRNTRCYAEALSYRLRAGQFSLVRSHSKAVSEYTGLAALSSRSALRMARSWSFADDRRVIELAKASKSLEEAARIMKRTPERIRKVSMRLGVSFKATGRPSVEVVDKRKPTQKL